MQLKAWEENGVMYFPWVHDMQHPQISLSSSKGSLVVMHKAHRPNKTKLNTKVTQLMQS